MAKVTGIGGIFIKSDQPEQLKSWYKTHLQLPIDQYGWTFVWKDDKTNKKALTQWSIMESRSNYFDPSQQPFMVNYRVDDLHELLTQLKRNGISQIGNMEQYDYGKFAWIQDPDGNKIELWEPVDEALLNE